MTKKMDGKTAAITGAASGIGLECARIFVEEGAQVVLIVHAKDRLNAAYEKLGANAKPLVIHLLDGPQASGMVPQIEALVGPLDILHANAGAYVGGATAEGNPDAWGQMLNLNINAAFRRVQAVLPRMIERKTDDVIFTSSVAGAVPVVWDPIYNASKFAMQAFLHATRRQVSEHGIRMGVGRHRIAG